MTTNKKYVIGVDYGSDSCRSILVDTTTGQELKSAVATYPRWEKNLYCLPKENQYRQHPLDYIEVLIKTVQEIITSLDQQQIKQIVGLSIDTTGSTPAIINKEGMPLALLPEFAENPNAMFVLWKDHTAVKEADEINTLAHNWATDFTVYSGGTYSSEWAWAKMMHVIRNDQEVLQAAYSWCEHSDWMPALLVNKTQADIMPRNRCAAGHKAMWHESWGGLPEDKFWISLEPKMNCFTGHLYKETVTVNQSIGTLSPEWAEKLGLHTDIQVGVGALDAHMGSIGAEIKPRSLVRVMGTSTCDMLVSSKEEIKDKQIKGICGQVDGSILPGLIGMEAGQSAFGDIYAWFKRLITGPFETWLEQSTLIDDITKEKLKEDYLASILPRLNEACYKVSTNDEQHLVATDWFNGRRTPDADQRLKGAITGLTLGSDAPAVYRSLVEATACGSKAIVDCFTDQGIKIDCIVAIGGIAKKAEYVMQVLADTLQMPIKVMKSEQSCALGAAMCAAVVAGIFTDLPEAQKNLGQGIEKEYKPNKSTASYFQQMYERYHTLGHFCTKNK